MPSPKSPAVPKQPPSMRLEQAVDLLLEREREVTAKKLEAAQAELVSDALEALDRAPLDEWFPEVNWDYVSHTDEYVIVRDELAADGSGVEIGVIRETGAVFIPLAGVGLRLPIDTALELASYVMGVQG